MKDTKSTISEQLNKPKVLFTFVEAGMGHIRPSEGVAKAFEAKYGDVCDIEKWYIFRDSKYRCVRRYAKMLLNDVKLLHSSSLHSVVEYCGSKLVGKKGSLFFVDLFNTKAKHRSTQEIVEKKPDMLVNTYFSPAHFALQARKKGLINCPIIQYSPDPYIYNVWDRNISEYDLFFVNNEKAYNHAIKTGFKKTQVIQVPFVTPYSISQFDKFELREKLNLPKDRFTVLLASGGYGWGKHYKISKALAKSNLPITVITVCGTNKKVLEKLNKLKKSSNLNLVVLGYTHKFLEYVQASDLFIGKGGSNTLCECMMCGVPFVVNHYGGVLEKITANYYGKTCGCGECITNTKKVVKFVKKVSQQPALLDRYIVNSLPYRRSDGAEIMADMLYEHLMKWLSGSFDTKA